MEFLSSDRTTFSRQVRLVTPRQNGQNEAVIWAAIIAILAALCAFSWTFCMYVFGRPEKAFNYNLLVDLEKLEPLEDYQPGNAPRGKFHAPRDLYQLYFNNNPRALRALSAVLRRQYVTNFHGVERVTYLRGDYLIDQVRQLGPGDVFPSGVLFRGRAEDYPNVLVEYILPAPTVPLNEEALQANKLLEIATSSVCAAVINVARLDGDRLLFTAIPIVYGDYGLPAGNTLQLKPPARLNLYAKFPISGTDPTPSPSESPAPPAPAPSGKP
jgi:hypothetical protein